MRIFVCFFYLVSFLWWVGGCATTQDKEKPTPIVQKNVYVLKFIGFTSAQRNKLEEAIGDLEEGENPAIRVLPGGQSSGAGFWTLRIQWLHKGNVNQVVRTIQETSESNGVGIEIAQITQEFILLKPKSMEEDEDIESW